MFCDVVLGIKIRMRYRLKKLDFGNPAAKHL